MALDTWVSIATLLATALALGGAMFGMFRSLRGEMNGLRGEMNGLRTEMRGEMNGLRTELRGEMKELRTELKGDIGELKADVSDLRKISVDTNRRVDNLYTLYANAFGVANKHKPRLVLRDARLG